MSNTLTTGVSTNMNSTYLRSNFIATFQDSTGTQYIDYFGSNAYNLFKLYVNAYSIHTVIQKENLDYISYVNYNTTSLWWAIALFNNIVHPMQVGVGQQLKIPIKSNIDTFVLEFKNSNVSVQGSSSTIQV